jgi:hypothetical protein
MSETRAYRCRDIGYGVETGEVRWPAVGGRDWTGKREYRTIDGGTVYLFDDEIQAPTCSDCGRRVADPNKHADYVSTINGERHELWIEPGAGTVLGPVCTGHRAVDVWTVGR